MPSRFVFIQAPPKKEREEPSKTTLPPSYVNDENRLSLIRIGIQLPFYHLH